MRRFLLALLLLALSTPAYAFGPPIETKTVPDSVSKTTRLWDKVLVEKGDTLTAYCVDYLKAKGNGASPMACAVTIGLANPRRFEVVDDLDLIRTGEPIWVPSYKNPATRAKDPLADIDDINALREALGLTTLKGDVDALRDKLVDQAEQLDAIKRFNEFVAEENQGQIQELNERANRTVEVVEGLGERVGDVESAVDTLNQDVGATKGRVATVEKDLGTIRGDVATLAGQDAEQNVKISELDSAIRTLENAVGERIGSVESQVAAIEKKAPQWTQGYPTWLWFAGLFIGLMALAALCFVLWPYTFGRGAKKQADEDHVATRTAAEKAQTDVAALATKTTTATEFRAAQAATQEAIDRLGARVDAVDTKAQEAHDLATIGYCITTEGNVNILDAVPLLRQLRAIAVGESIDLPIAVGNDVLIVQAKRLDDKQVELTGLTARTKVRANIENVPVVLAKAIVREMKNPGDGFERSPPVAA